MGNSAHSQKLPIVAAWEDPATPLLTLCQAVDACTGGDRSTRHGKGRRRSDNDAEKRRFECETCHVRFSYKHVLQNHIRTHTGEKPFVCQQPGCDKRFTRDHHLKTHMRLHTGEKPFACSTCGKKFVQVANLRRHEDVHVRARIKTYKSYMASLATLNQFLCTPNPLTMGEQASVVTPTSKPIKVEHKEEFLKDSEEEPTSKPTKVEHKEEFVKDLEEEIPEKLKEEVALKKLEEEVLQELQELKKECMEEEELQEEPEDLSLKSRKR